jgi:hypothetical protein
MHERHEPPTVHERVAAFWWGQWDEDVPGWLNLCDIVASDPVAKYLYQFSNAGDMAGDEAVKQLESWCHGMAAECAMSINSRKLPRIPSYRPEWGRQAAKDGAALAMWGADIRDVLPGVNKRAERYGCRSEAYIRVRDYVEAVANELISDFSRDMEQAHFERFDPWFRERWERKMGKAFPRLEQGYCPPTLPTPRLVRGGMG